AHDPARGHAHADRLRQLHAGGALVDARDSRRGLRADRARQGPAAAADRLGARGPQRAAAAGHPDRAGARLHRGRRAADRGDLQLARHRPGHVHRDRAAGLPDAAGRLPDPDGLGDPAELPRRPRLLPARPEDHDMTLPLQDPLLAAGLADGGPPPRRGGFLLDVLRNRKAAVVGLAIIAFFLVLAIVAPYISPYSAAHQTCPVYAPPSPRH